MLKNKVIKDIIKTALTIYLLIVFIFAILSIFNISWLLGWIVGGFTSMMSFLLGAYLISKISLRSSKIKAFWMGFIRSLIQMIVHAVVFIIIIAIDTSVNHLPFFNSGIDSILKPINFITYLSSIVLITVSTLIASLMRKDKNGNIQGKVFRK